MIHSTADGDVDLVCEAVIADKFPTRFDLLRQLPRNPLPARRIGKVVFFPAASLQLSGMLFLGSCLTFARHDVKSRGSFRTGRDHGFAQGWATIVLYVQYESTPFSGRYDRVLVGYGRAVLGWHL